MQLVLASSSAYRRALLARLQLPFSCLSPEVDESPLPGETAGALAGRLAEAKARAVARQYPAALIIGSDQVCLAGDRIFGKPGGFEQASAQLQFMSGRQAEFHTALVLYNSATGELARSHDIYTIKFRNLSEPEITHYLKTEQPYDCAGSFKAESLGIALFESMAGKDFHSLLGLPLISLCTLLREAGLNPLLPGSPAAPASPGPAAR